MNRRVKEWFKSALIVLLAAALPALTVAIWLFDTPVDWSRAGPAAAARALGLVSAPPETIAVAFDLQYTEAARPSRAVWTQDGLHRGAQYDAALLDELYEYLKDFFRGALGSAGQPIRQPTSAWLKALSADANVYWDYNTDLPLQTLALWFSAENPVLPDWPVRRMALVLQEDSVFLWFVDQRDGTPYRCPTALTGQDVPNTVPSGLLPCRFGFEDAAFPRAPFLLLFDRPPSFPGAAFQPADLTPSVVDAFLKELRIKPNPNAFYTDEEGTTYVDDPRTCLFTPQGVIRYLYPVGIADTSEGAAQTSVSSQTAEAIEESRALLSTLSPLLRDARFSFLDASVSSDGSVITVSFGYESSGLSVRLSEGPPAVLVFTHGRLTEANVRVLSFARGDEPSDLMPDTMVYQLLTGDASHGDLDLRLSYGEGGEERLAAGWEYN